MSTEDHISDQDLKALHKQGACLTRHQKRTEGHLCSHQWQAVKKTEDNASMYNHPAYASLCGDDAFQVAVRITKKLNQFPPNYADFAKDGNFYRKKPKKGDWDVGNGNFNDWRKPYWHNAHHIVPNRALSDAIQEVADEAEKPPIVRLIKAGLLKADYNLNDKMNMIILPMERIVAAALALPRHLIGDQVGPDQQKEMRSHVNYSAQVEKGVIRIVRPYKDTVLSSIKGVHDIPKYELVKRRLEILSDSIFNQMKGVAGGAALSEITFNT